MKLDNFTWHTWWSPRAPQFAQWLKNTSLNGWNFFDGDNIKAIHHVAVTLCRLPTFLVMVITAPSMWLQTHWSKLDVPGWPLVPWPSPTSRTTSIKSATASIHKAGPSPRRKAGVPVHNLGPWAMRKDKPSQVLPGPLCELRIIPAPTLKAVIASFIVWSLRMEEKAGAFQHLLHGSQHGWEDIFTFDSLVMKIKVSLKSLSKT